jgi:hypothetical protein
VRRAGALVLVAVLLAACSDNPPPLGPTPSSAVPVLTVNAVLDRIAAAGLPADNVKIWTAETDPVHLLGRPGGYDAAASFDVPGADLSATEGRIGRGGVIEVWPAPSAAADRVRFIQNTLSGAGGALGTEYDYQDGPVLLRITGALIPDTAAKYGKALTS